MPKIAYIEKRFNKNSVRLITLANEIIEEYQAQGFSLTLRQLYYQLVARDYIPNQQKQYKRLSAVISDARLTGLVDWDAIIDRTREVRKNSHWDSPKDILSEATEQYRIDKWEDQPYRPEVWIEKDALIGVIEGVCERLDVSYFACRGYNSQSEMWQAGAVRFNDSLKNGQVPFIIHLGDHDASGIDMTRDITDRTELFTGRSQGDGFIVKRIALNYDQVQQYSPPPNPAKLSDPRAGDYIKQFGRQSWELDALDPVTIAGLIEAEIMAIRDETEWAQAEAREQKERQVLKALADGVD